MQSSLNLALVLKLSVINLAPIVLKRIVVFTTSHRRLQRHIVVFIVVTRKQEAMPPLDPLSQRRTRSALFCPRGRDRHTKRTIGCMRVRAMTDREKPVAVSAEPRLLAMCPTLPPKSSSL